MKKSLFARGITGAVASLLGVVAVGCGAGTGADGQVDTQSQALSGMNPSVAAAATVVGIDSDVDPTAGVDTSESGRWGAASCVIRDPHDNRDKMLVAGGFTTSTGSAVDDLLLYDPVANTWTLLEKMSGGSTYHLKTPRALLAGIKTASSKCVFLGGTASYDNTNHLPGTALKDVDEVVLNANGTVTINNLTDMTKARASFAVSTCGTQIMVFGGYDNAQTGSAKWLRSIERSDDLDPGSWTDSATALTTGVFDAAFAKDPAADQYILAGGNVSAGLSDAVQIVKTSSCAPTVTNQASKLSSAVEGPVAFFEGSSTGTTTTFVIAGGKASGPTALSTAYEAVVTWSTPSVAVSDANAPDLSTATYLPVVVKTEGDPSSGIAHMLLGGTGNTDTFTANSVEQYQDTYSETSGWYTAALNTGRVNAVAEKIGSFVYIVTGKTVASSGATITFPKDMDRITP